MTIKLLIADDYDIIRQKIKSSIGKQPDMKVVGEAKDGQNAVKLAQALVPDVVLMDLTMPKMNGIEAARNILMDNPGIRIIILSMHSHKRFVVDALKAGVSGYVLKSSLVDDLIRAIRAVMSNEFFLSPRITDVAIQDYIKQPPKADESDSSGLKEPEH